MTEADLREIEDRQRTLGDKAPRLAIAMLMLDVEKLIAEVRRLAQTPAVCQERNGPWRCVDVPGHDGGHVWQAIASIDGPVSVGANITYKDSGGETD